MGALTRRKGYGMVLLTPRRVAFAAAEAFAEGLLGFAPGQDVSIGYEGCRDADVSRATLLENSRLHIPFFACSFGAIVSELVGA